MNRKDFQNAFGDADEAFRLRLRHTLNGLEDKKMKKKYRLSTVLIAAVLLVAVLAGAGVAANELGVFHLLTDTAQPILPLEGAEQMVEKSLGHSENEYARLSVDQAVFDGQGLLLQCRLTPKDTEKYALFDAFMQNADEEHYIIEETLDEVNTGELAWVFGTQAYQLNSENGEYSLTCDGKSVSIPQSMEEANERGVLFFEKDGKLYYSYTIRNVIGRKDDKEIMGYWISGKENDGLITIDTADAREEADGSIVWWMSGMSDTTLDSDRVNVSVSAYVQLGEEKYPLDDVTFEMPKIVQERKYSIVPVDDTFDTYFDEFSGSIVFTKVRGYLTLECSYPVAADEEMDVSFQLCNLDGEEINVGSGYAYEDSGKLIWRMVMQSTEEIPERILVQAVKAGDGDCITQVECKLVEEPVAG